ncbi:uncharacterized protein LOC108105178 [Drosophila eugracilis]|uniref:uncharacterized protein LOC108105178 n=1 Tax=Drosophila eugracilis TaxID=29029 RepID=UPI001BDA4A40|nr:uncharacterized protein LOC108105178 [Drosophila eugracilis]
MRNVSRTQSKKSTIFIIDSDEDQFEDMEECEEYSYGLTTDLSRNQSIILDYKEFKAARVIQRHVRGWLVRHHLKELKASAVIIQKWWRRFLSQRNLIFVAENALQLVVLAHYDKCSRLIQTLYRGWWSRKHIFDLTMLKRLQVTLSKDLIHTLVKYCYITKNSEHLPGLYTIRDSSLCLKTLEQLMATFGFRYYNSKASYKMSKALNTVQQGRKVFEAAKMFTNIPYPGFNDRGYCDNRALSSIALNVPEPEYFELIYSFLDGLRKMDMSVAAKWEQKIAIQEEKTRLNRIIEKENERKRFVKRILQDMRHWHYSNGKPILSRIVFKHHETIDVLHDAKNTLVSIFGQLEPCICPTAEDLAKLENYY